MFTHRKAGFWDWLRIAQADLHRMTETRWDGPCGHECNGNSKSWWCSSCGSSGSES